MRIMLLLLFVLTSLLLNGCASYQKMNRQEECEKTIKNYNRMIRWQEAEKASIVFVDTKQRLVFDKGAELLRRRGITIADYRILAQECLPDKMKAEATVEFDYFVLPDYRLKTATDRQSWVFREQNPAEADPGTGWKLISPLPDFK
jgi:uncharacterized protein YceK